MVLGYDEVTQIATIEQRNKFSPGDRVEFLTRQGEGFEQVIEAIWDETDTPLETANRVQQLVRVRTEQVVEKYDIMRIRKSK